MPVDEEAIGEPAPYVGMVRNSGEPIKFEGFTGAGVVASTTFPGEEASVIQRMAITSDDYKFPDITEGLSSGLEALAMQAGYRVQISAATWTIAVIKPDGSGQLWVDTAAVSTQVRLKRAAEAGQAIFAADVADVTSVNFPCLEFETSDRVVVIFRESWRYALFFDLTQQLDPSVMGRTLGGLHRYLRYHKVYGTLSSPATFDRMLAEGWFPFIEIFNNDFDLLVPGLLGQEPFERANRMIGTRFDGPRIQAMVSRWHANPLFAKRMGVLRPGIDAFIAEQPVTSIKTLLTEIEGVIQDAHISITSSNAKLPGLLQFTRDRAHDKAGALDTMFFPAEFQQYLLRAIYPNFDPLAAQAHASRHTVGHGAAPADAYTLTKALQVILTLDQLSWYL